MTEKCVVCGLRWHVCRDKEIPPGRLCLPPRCDGNRGQRPEGEHLRTYREEKEK